jgi:2-keto-myo-inositol isomerase
MKLNALSRREVLARTGLIVGAAFASPVRAADNAPGQPSASPSEPFRFSLNMATIRGQKLGIVKEVEIAAQAGYSAIEPWVESVAEYAKNGGSLSDLKKRIADLGLTVEGAIGFAEWIVDDDEKRAKGMERAKNEMELIARIGGKRIAAPPAGANNTPGLDPIKAAERYRALLEAGDQIGIVPELELWGFSQNLHRLSECAMVAIQTGHPKACILADVFHLYKGGSDYHGWALLSPNAVQVLHMNDYPAEPPRDKINDSFRVYPGDGVAPLVDILRTLRATGGQKVLSLELFSRKFWEQDPREVAKAGLGKMKAVAQRALETA